MVHRFFVTRLVIPVVVFAFFASLAGVALRTQQIYQAHHRFAKGMDHALSFWMSQAHRTLRELAWMREDSSTEPTIQEMSARDFYRIVFTKAGNLAAPYPVEEATAQEVLKIPLSLFPDRYEWPAVSVPYYSREHEALTVGVLVRADHWVAFGELKLDLFYRLISGFLRQEPGKQVIITDRYGNVIYHPHERRIRERENLAHEPLIQKALRHAQPMELLGKLDGSWVFANSWRVDPWGWVIFVVQPLVPAVAPVVAMSVTATALILLMAALLTWRFRVGLQAAVIEPITSFGKTVDALTMGRPDRSPPEESGPPTFLELARLREQFRTMSETLRTREETLRAQRRELDRILDSISNGVIVTDTQGRILRMNTAAQDLTGCNRLQCLGKTVERIFSRVHPQERMALTDAMDQVLSTGRVSRLSRPLQIENPEGGLYSLAVRAAPLRDEAGNVLGIVTVFSDVTELEESRRDLAESEEKFRTLAQMSPVAVLLYQDDKWVYANPVSEAITGYKAEELMGQNFWDVVHPDFQDVVRRRGRRRQLGRNDAPNYELKIVTKTGEEKWCYLRGGTTSFRGRPAGIIAVMDITELKEAQQALAESERKYREILDSMEDAYMELDQRGVATFYNPALLRLLECKPEDLRNKTYDDFADPSNARKMEQFFKDVARQGRTRSLQDFLIRDTKGHQKIVEVSAGVRRDDQGRILGLRVLARDVTEKTRAEEKSRSLEKMLIQAQKMESLGTLASGVAHEFNNLLQAMSGYLELIIKTTPSEDPRRKWVDRVHEATQKAGDLVKRLLAFARPNEPHLEPVRMHRVIEETLLILERSIPRMIELRKELDPNVLPILADRLQLEQVIINLVANSRDAMPPEKPGAITIRTQEISGKDGTPWVQISVSDTGAGIPREIQDRIFDPFFTTKEPGKGTGLGLSTVYGIIRGHGGTIQYTSTPGEGTTFTIRLPGRRLPLQEEAGTGGEGEEQQPPSGFQPDRATILVVDDEEPLLDFVQAGLEMENYQVLTATSGEKALEILSRSNGAIQWVLLDLNMPGMGGRRCLEEIRTRYPHIKILVASGYSVHSLDEPLERYGVRAFLQKPYRFAELLAALQRS